MQPLETTFWQDVSAFTLNHKALCVLTLGLAIVGYSIGNLAGRAVHVIVEAFGTTLKTEDVARSALNPSAPLAEAKELPKDENNRATLKALSRVIAKGAKLPAGWGASKMTGEEHIAAILYQILIHNENRTDCSILINPASKEIVPPNFKHTKARFYLFPMSVNNNTHNTILIIDNKKKTYAYFDSLGGTLTEEQRLELQKKEVISHEFEEEDTKSVTTRQSDDWSCGFHAVQNALSRVDDERPYNTNSSGKTLRDAFMPYFAAFANTYGFSVLDMAKRNVIKRQKVCFRDALEKFNKDHNDKLKNLYDKLVLEQNPSNENRYRPLSDFANDYIDTFPDDADAVKILNEAITLNGSIFNHLPSSSDETEAEIESKTAKILDNIQRIMS